jgi:hypothetical protein
MRMGGSMARGSLCMAMGGFMRGSGRTGSRMAMGGF